MHKSCLNVRVVLSALVLGLAWSLPAKAEGPLEKAAAIEKAEKVEPVVIRMYNVQDLVLGRDYPFPGGIAAAAGLEAWAAGAAAATGGGGTLYAAGPTLGDAAAMTSALTPQVLEDIIERTVGSGSWADEGGRCKFERVGALLVITQTAENHKKIADLLDQFRAARRMIAIETQWVLLDDAKIAKLLPQDGLPRTVPTEVSPAALRDAGAVVIYRGQITCFDRQTVHLVCGRLQTYVSGATPVISENAVGWDPTVSAAIRGALLQITPSLSADGKAVTVDLQSIITEPGPMRTQTVTAEAGGVGKAGAAPTDSAKGSSAQVELPEVLVQTFRATLRMPLDKAVLVGGTSSPKATDGKVLYLILQAAASQQDIQAQTQPEEKKPAK